jgi:hypothetical protein
VPEDEYSAQPKTWRSRNFFGKILFTFSLLSLRSDFHSEILFYQFSQQLQLRAPLPVLTYTDYPVPGLPSTIPRIFVYGFHEPCPPLHHYVHKRPDLSVPPIPLVKDTSFGSCDKYHVLNTYQNAQSESSFS